MPDNAPHNALRAYNETHPPIAGIEERRDFASIRDSGPKLFTDDEISAYQRLITVAQSGDIALVQSDSGPVIVAIAPDGTLTPLAVIKPDIPGDFTKWDGPDGFALFNVNGAEADDYRWY